MCSSLAGLGSDLAFNFDSVNEAPSLVALMAFYSEFKMAPWFISQLLAVIQWVSGWNYSLLLSLWLYFAFSVQMLLHQYFLYALQRIFMRRGMCTFREIANFLPVALFRLLFMLDIVLGIVHC